MKTKAMLMMLFCVILITSCRKTYVCVDEAQNTTGEVKAWSQSKAKSLCPSNGSVKLK